MKEIRSQKIFELLKKEYQDAKIALDFDNDFQLLTAVILSAQCTDKRVNMVTPVLFKKFSKVNDFANADINEIKKIIFSTGFYNSKAKNIIGCAKKIVLHHGGKVPLTMKELLILPGVARKTANVVLGFYGICDGIVVDTHVIRLSGRLHFVSEKLWKSKNALKIEQKLMALFSKKNWCLLPHLLILHGRQICDARKPHCRDCVIKNYCPSCVLYNGK